MAISTNRHEESGIASPGVIQSGLFFVPMFILLAMVRLSKTGLTSAPNTYFAIVLGSLFLFAFFAMSKIFRTTSSWNKNSPYLAEGLGPSGS